MEKGLIHIYTGDGKGKTTAAVGITARAHSQGLSAAFAQFFKEKDPNNEIALLQRLGVATYVFDAVKSPLFTPDIDRNLLHREAVRSLEQIGTLFEDPRLDLLVIDEFICLIAEGVLSEGYALSFLKKRPPSMELILTGKGATEKLMEQADYVTFMRNVRHPFARKLEARRGIEF